MDTQRCVVVGATGMIGGLVLRYLLDHEIVATVTALGRRPLDQEHTRLRDVRHTDFGDFSTATEKLAGHDVAFFCLGVYTGAVPDEELRRITVDYAIAFAEAFHRANPSAALCFLSGEGADQSERSRMSFARYKGAAEKALLGMGFPRLHIFRPGYIYPVERRVEPNTSYRLFRVLYPLLKRVYPNVGVRSDELARVMVRAGLLGTPGLEGPVLRNADIRRLAASA